jgi:hypothetical protein
MESVPDTFSILFSILTPFPFPRRRTPCRAFRTRTEKKRTEKVSKTEKVSGAELQLVTYSDVTLLPQCGPKNHGIGS